MKSRTHFHALDGLRGIAALSVTLFHWQWALSGKYFLAHSYLAVNFFFVLSGFVLAFAFERRLSEGMSVWRFMLARAVRLYPMLVLGVGLDGLYIFVNHAHVVGYAQPRSYLVLTILTSMFALPAAPGLMNYAPFPIDPPIWTLFFELVVNALYALFVWRLGIRALAAIVAAIGLFLVFAISKYGSLDTMGYLYVTMLAGLARCGFSFFVGVLLFRLHAGGLLPRLDLGFLPLALVLFSCFVPKGLGAYEIFYELFCVAIALPLIVVAGASGQPRGAVLEVAKWSGILSYPINVLHYAIFDWLNWTLHVRVVSGYGVLAAATALVVAISYLLAEYYDTPIRRLLGARLLGTRVAAPPAAAG